MNYQFDRSRKRPTRSRYPSTQLPAKERSSHAGQQLDPATRQEMETLFDHDFSDVRIHTGNSSMPPGANAFTTGEHISFRRGRYSPRSPQGKELLAHELAHVVQQRNTSVQPNHTSPESEAQFASRAAAQAKAVDIHSSVAQGSVQYDNGSQDDERRWRLRMPQLGESLGYQASPLRIGEPGQWQLRIDPQIQAQIQAMQMVRSQLSLESLEQAVRRESTSAPDISPQTAARSIPSPDPQPDPFSVPATPPREPLVPAGRGPERPRAASMRDILRATLRIPAVRAGINRLRDQASERVRRDWSRLSTGEQALVISQGVIIGAGALTGIALSPDARQFALDQIQGRNIPIPGLPVTFRFNVTGQNQHLMIMTNVGQLLPPSLGFR